LVIHNHAFVILELHGSSLPACIALQRQCPDTRITGIQAAFMNNLNTPGNTTGAPAKNGLQVEALFRARIWDGLREATVEVMGRQRWREVMMAALNNGDDLEEDPLRVPLQRLIEEVVFILGTNKVTLFERMGRRMMGGLLAEVDPLLKRLSDPAMILAVILDRTVLGELGVVDIQPEHAEDGEATSYFRMRTVALFRGGAAFHIAALKELGDQIGIRFDVELASPDELTGEGNAYRICWGAIRG
jgi:hypothetical protein